MRIRVLLSVLVLSPSVLLSQQFSGFADFLRKYEASPPEVRQTVARAFVAWQQARGGFPIVEADGNAVFFYLGRGDEADVRVVGDFRPGSFFSVYWDTVGEPLTRAGGIFYRRRAFEPDARIDYAFVVDGRRTPDPLNPRTLFSGPGGGEASELVMPGHRLPAEVVERPGVPRGTLQVVREPWAVPKVSVYLPPGYDRSRDYPTLYTTDGSAWAELVRLPTILDNLIADREIEPVIAVMIDAAPDRSAWYSYNPDYLAYLRRVVEYVDGRYATRKSAAQRLHAGSSAGGRATAYVGLELPELFGNLAMLSPSFSGPVYYWEPYFGGRKRPAPHLRVWMSAGTYEGYIHRDAQTMQAYFERVGIPTRAVYVHQGHSFGAWREGAVQMLRHFLSRQGRSAVPIR
ncbi:MAG: alpha/beta hydrolase-fold protein [Gemmatimonadota bacterium]|nr:alpha/beta hydrolase-fold protein [Gemmatimonadota bacterium]